MGSETALNRRITGDLDADRQRKGKKCYSILLSLPFHSGEGNTAESEDLILFELSTVWTQETRVRFCRPHLQSTVKLGRCIRNPSNSGAYGGASATYAFTCRTTLNTTNGEGNSVV